MIEDSEENRKLRGARATVHEHEDGTVTILRYEGRELPYHVHLKDDARVTQASIVEHDRLEAAFRWIAERQKQRDAERLTSPQGDAADQAAHPRKCSGIRPLVSPQ